MDKITLIVGEKTFQTFAARLTTRCGYFASLVSEGKFPPQLNGAYFLDADPTVFGHILTYLRNGVFPVFYDSANGHDYALYLALEQEARELQIPDLENWLKKKGYLEAVKLSYSVEVREGSNLDVKTHAGEEVEYRLTWQTKKIYVFPRGIDVHRGRRAECGHKCNNARVGADIYEDEKVLKTMIIRKPLVFDDAALVQDN